MKHLTLTLMRRYIAIFMFLALGVIAVSECHAQTAPKEETKTIPPITVTDRKETDSMIKPAEITSGTTEKIDKTIINIQGGPEQISPYKALSTQPGVDIRFRDGFGMELSHRIRGKSDRNIGETLEGLPLKGIGPGIGLSTMIDLENIESIVLEKGAISADSGFGYGSDNGMVDMRIKTPSNDPHVTLKQVLGSQTFSRSYFRGDSGNVGDIAKVFISGSYTRADKWKGSGQSPDGRKNCAFGISGTSDQPIEWAVYSVYNEDNRHSYRGLSYEQTQDLSRYRDFDYNSTLTGNSSQDVNYYDYNRQHFKTYTFIGKLKAPITNQSSITFKPYYLRDEGYSYSGAGNKIIDWLIEHDTYGAMLEYMHTIGGYEFKLGWWYQEDEPPGPPTSRKNRSTNGLAFLGWERLAEATNHKFSSPYITVKKAFGGATINLGLKYLWITKPDFTYYDTAGIPDVDYDTALSLASDVDFKLKGRTHEVFLPNIGVTYELSKTSLLRANYGKNYNTPQYGLGGQIVNLRNKGLTEQELQKMWEDLEPETSDNFDFGFIYNNGRAFISSTIFYSLVENVGGSFYDPILKMNYSQNTGEAHSYGLELATGYAFTPNFNVGLSATYNKYEFTTDIEAARGSTIQAEGHQIPDVPEFMANLSANWRIGGFMITPTVRYLGQRYVDVENEYSVDSCFLADLALSKTFKIAQKHDLTLSFSVTNLLDEEYISVVSASDISLGRENPTYYVGAPRTFFFSLQYDF